MFLDYLDRSTALPLINPDNFSFSSLGGELEVARNFRLLLF